MAKITLGPMVSEARNKLGAQVFSRNKAGAYTRAWVKPLQPPSYNRDYVQANMKAIILAWQSTLTDAQRAAWEGFAQAYPQNLPQVGSKPVSSFTIFTKVNLIQMFDTGIVMADPPADQSVEMLGDCLFNTLTHTGPSVKLEWSPTLPATTFIHVYLTGSISPGITNFERYLKIVADEPVNVAQPYDVTTVYTSIFGAPIAGKRVGLKAVLMNSLNGALSIETRVSKIVA